MEVVTITNKLSESLHVHYAASESEYFHLTVPEPNVCGQAMVYNMILDSISSLNMPV